jgi:hypothetical protein
MIRGTTPTHTFSLPFDANTISKLSIAYAQGGTVKIEKALEDCTISGNEIETRLTEEDTLKLNANAQVEIQIRCAIGEERLASNIIFARAEKILKDGML